MPTTTTTILPSLIPNLTNISLSALDAVNRTVGDWHVEPLPSDIRVINGSIVMGSKPNTTTISRITDYSVGSVPLIPFIYMITSLLIILIMIPESVEWVQSISGKRHKWEPNIGASTLTPRKFERKLLRSWPNTEQALQTLSQAETVQRNQGTESRDIRECQELIREKFGLDIKVYNMRDAKRSDRHIVEDNMRRRDGALKDVKKITQGWKAARQQWSDEEYALVQEIHDRVQRLD